MAARWLSTVRKRLGAFAVAQLGKAADLARARGIPIDAVVRLAQLRIGQHVGRAVAQAAADHGQQLAGHGMQRIAAHAQRPDAQARGQDQGGAFAHSMPLVVSYGSITAVESGGFMSECRMFPPGLRNAMAPAASNRTMGVAKTADRRSGSRVGRGRPQRGQPALLDDGDPVGVARRHVEIVQDGQHAQPAVDPAAGAGQGGMLVGEVEAGDRLVEQQEGPCGRIGVALRQDAGELDPLAFAARQNGIGPIGKGERLGLGQRLLRQRAASAGRTGGRDGRAGRARRSAGR